MPGTSRRSTGGAGKARKRLPPKSVLLHGDSQDNVSAEAKVLGTSLRQGIPVVATLKIRCLCGRKEFEVAQADVRKGTADPRCPKCEDA